MGYLERSVIHELLEAAVATGLASQRSILTAGIDPEYLARMPFGDSPYSQIILDLQKMNQDGPLRNGTFPLLIWLRNAASSAKFMTKGAIFLEWATRIDERVKGASSVPGLDLLAESTEAVFHTDDRLNFEYFSKAVEAGSKVVRVTVPAFDDGQRKIGADGQAVETKGTGWVFGRAGLVMTNYHVVLARPSKYSEIETADLDRQIEGTLVEFDAVQDTSQLSMCEVESLVACDIELDFALLQLDNACPGREPLVLRQKRIEVDAEEGEGPGGKAYVPVNIIQHPDGGPKKVAFRNNVVTDSGPETLRYFTDTEKGSSGSPVCDDQWQVVALHRSTGKLGKVVNFQGREEAAANIGTQMEAILEHLRGDAAVWTSIEQRLDIL